MLTKTQKIELRKQGKTILREQFRPSNSKWIIAFNTEKGGWAAFDLESYNTKQHCIEAIKAKCKLSKKFIYDE